MCITNNPQRWNEAGLNQPAQGMSPAKQLAAVLTLSARRKQLGLDGPAQDQKPALGSPGGGLGG